jgi:hypothetical protein
VLAPHRNQTGSSWSNEPNDDDQTSKIPSSVADKVLLRFRSSDREDPACDVGHGQVDASFCDAANQIAQRARSDARQPSRKACVGETRGVGNRTHRTLTARLVTRLLSSLESSTPVIVDLSSVPDLTRSGSYLFLRAEERTFDGSITSDSRVSIKRVRASIGDTT